MSDFSGLAITDLDGRDLAEAAACAHDTVPRPAIQDTVVGIVLAGGEGTRLAPLTRGLAKPAVAFGPRHRVIDFALSNLANSGVRCIHVLVQHNARSVNDHLRAAWQNGQEPGFVRTVRAQGRPFTGTADAVRQSLSMLQVQSGALVLVFGADHVYRMDVAQMIDVHRAQRADVTVAALPVPRLEARAFGVIGCDADGRIHSFLEKPRDPPGVPGDPTRALASMGNYVFSAAALMRALREPAGCEERDFGKDILPRLLRQRERLYAYDFTHNRVPGLSAREHPAYWRDVGTLDAYFAASLDTLGSKPQFDLANPHWPIHSVARAWPPARLVRCALSDSHVGAGALIRGAYVRNSIVRRAAVINDDVQLDQCVIMDHAKIGVGARLRRVIVDRHAVVPDNACIGFDPQHDADRWTVTAGGITIVTNTQSDDPT